MPEIGLLELTVIGILAFLVLGPEKLPEFFAQIGRFMRQGKTWYHKMRYQLEQETNALKQPVTAMRDELLDSQKKIKERIEQDISISKKDD